MWICDHCLSLPPGRPDLLPAIELVRVFAAHVQSLQCLLCVCFPPSRIECIWTPLRSMFVIESLVLTTRLCTFIWCVLSTLICLYLTRCCSGFLRMERSLRADGLRQTGRVQSTGRAELHPFLESGVIPTLLLPMPLFSLSSATG